jgi:hypothetical protein
MTDESNPANESAANAASPLTLSDAVDNFNYYVRQGQLSIDAAIAEPLINNYYRTYNQTNPKTMETFMGKRIADYTIANVVRKPPVWLTRRLSEDELTDCKNNLNYLAGLLEFDATLANEVFVSLFNRDTFFALEQKDINTVVSSYMQAKLSKLHTPLTDEYKAFINNQEKHFQKNSLEDLERKAAGEEQSVENYVNSVANAQETLARAMVALRETTERHEAALQAVADYDPTDSIDRKRMEYFQELSETTNWYYVGTELYLRCRQDIKHLIECDTEDLARRRYTTYFEDKDIFIAKTPLVTSEIDVANGISRSLECGIPIVAFYRNSNQIAACNFLTKRPSSGSLHMHFTPNGVCWGNMAHTVRQMESDPAPRHVDILKAFDETMAKYNAGSPYIAFATYQRKLKNAYPYTLTYYSYSQIPKQFLPAEMVEAYDTEYAKVAVFRQFKNDSVALDRDLERHVVDCSHCHESLDDRDTKQYLYDLIMHTDRLALKTEHDGIEHHDWAGHFADQLMTKGYDESLNNYTTEIPRKFHYLRPSARNVHRVLGFTLPKGTRMLRDNGKFYTIVGISDMRSFVYAIEDGATEPVYFAIGTEDVFELPADCPTDSLMNYLMYSSKSYKQGDSNEERTANQSA